jgi:hypothetical protein
VQGARTFAAAPPHFTPWAGYRTSNNRVDTKVSGKVNDDPREEECWKNNHTITATEEWGTMKGRFPVIPPLTKIVKIKNSVCNLFVLKLETSRGNWKDKTEEQRPSAKEADFNLTWQKPIRTDPKPGSAVTVEHMILFAHTAMATLCHSICMVEILQHHFVTVKLQKTRCFPAQVEFVGVDVTKEGSELTSGVEA